MDRMGNSRIPRTKALLKDEIFANQEKDNTLRKQQKYRYHLRPSTQRMVDFFRNYGNCKRQRISLRNKNYEINLEDELSVSIF